MDSKTLTFPNGFLWGSATAAHQVEGNNIHSDWWDFEQKGKTLSKETSGIAVDHYNRYEEDFDIAKSLGQNAHRFSIEWSRIEPEEGRFQIDEINHYKAVIKALKNRGMKVMVTLMHFTLPQWVAKKGGWSNKKTIRYFTRFIEQILPFFGEDVDFWITINEPITYSLNAYYKGTFPPGIKNLYSFSKVQSNLALAHREAFFTIHKFYKDAVVGLAKNIPVIDPYNSKSLADRAICRIVDWLGNNRFLNKIGGLVDFLGVQYYNHVLGRFQLGGNYAYIGEEYGVTKHKDPNTPVSDLGWEIYPEGIYRALKKVKKFKVPIIITENGVADKEDRLRAAFIRDHLVQIHRAMSEGIPVLGYFYWTLMDNYEWYLGRFPRFGLVEIDYEQNLKRRIRKSANYFAEICKQNAVVL